MPFFPPKQLFSLFSNKCHITNRLPPANPRGFAPYSRNASLSFFITTLFHGWNKKKQVKGKVRSEECIVSL